MVSILSVLFLLKDSVIVVLYILSLYRMLFLRSLQAKKQLKQQGFQICVFLRFLLPS